MARDLRKLRGKVILITGGAQGIGRKSAEEFIALGAKVAIGDLDIDLAKKTADEIGGDIVALPLDVTKYDQFEKFIDEAEKALGPIDVLVNNAGVMIIGSLLEEPQAVSDKQIAIDLNAVIFGSREAAKRMVARRSGHIVNIASVAGKVGVPGLATYNAAKFGVVGFSEALRVELDPHQVQVTTIMPWFSRTELVSGITPKGVMRLVRYQPVEKIAAAIVHAAAGRGRNAIIPGYLALLDPVVGVLRWLPNFFSKVIMGVGFAELLTGSAHGSARQAYIDRTTGQAAK